MKKKKTFLFSFFILNFIYFLQKKMQTNVFITSDSYYTFDTVVKRVCNICVQQLLARNHPDLAPFNYILAADIQDYTEKQLLIIRADYDTTKIEHPLFFYVHFSKLYHGGRNWKTNCVHIDTDGLKCSSCGN